MSCKKEWNGPANPPYHGVSIGDGIHRCSEEPVACDCVNEELLSLRGRIATCHNTIKRLDDEVERLTRGVTGDELLAAARDFTSELTAGGVSLADLEKEVRKFAGWHDAKKECPPGETTVMFRMGDGREIQGMIKSWALAMRLAEWWRCVPNRSSVEDDVVEWRFLTAEEKPHELSVDVPHERHAEPLLGWQKRGDRE